MFFTEEDIQPVVNDATKLFGPVGNMILDSNVGLKKNVSIATKKYGKVWYGDLLTDADTRAKLTQLAKSSEQTVYLLNEDFDFDHAIERINPA